MLSLVNDPKIVILHCADTPDYPFDSKDFDRFGALDIRDWHIKRGWEDIGYHWVIRRTGALETGRPEKAVGSHCQGYNTDSLGICWIGARLITSAQLDSLAALFSSLKTKYQIDADHWFGHYEFNASKTCPGFSMVLFRQWLKGLK